jgi:hypothetical protein
MVRKDLAQQKKYEQKLVKRTTALEGKAPDQFYGGGTITPTISRQQPIEGRGGDAGFTVKPVR